jgi:hypothetical protein
MCLHTIFIALHLFWMLRQYCKGKVQEVAKKGTETPTTYPNSRATSIFNGFQEQNVEAEKTEPELGNQPVATAESAV